MAEIGNQKFRFTENFDMHLAREVCGQNPYEDPKRWFVIQINMIQITGRSLSIRTLKERIQLLVKKYQTKNKLNEGKSGIEEVVTELDDLIQQIVDLIKTFKNVKRTCNMQNPTKSEKSSFQKGFDSREAYVAVADKNNGESSSSENNEITEQVSSVANVDFENVVTIESPHDVLKRKFAQENILSPRKRIKVNRKENTLQYLHQKCDKQHEIKCREIALQERKQGLDERKFELEIEEKHKRMELEEKRFLHEEKRLNMQLDILHNQNNLIQLVLQLKNFPEKVTYKEEQLCGLQGVSV